MSGSIACIAIDIAFFATTVLRIFEITVRAVRIAKIIVQKRGFSTRCAFGYINTFHTILRTTSANLVQIIIKRITTKLTIF